MIELILTRTESSPEGTFGLLEGEALRMHTGELPWRDNKVNVSCIPTGTYFCKPHTSPKFGHCFWLQAVPGRTEILIHAASWMGDRSLGWKTQLAGCIAIGMDFVRDADAKGQDMIQKSQIAVAKLIEYTEFKAFMLHIRNKTDIDMTIRR